MVDKIQHSEGEKEYLHLVHARNLLKEETEKLKEEIKTLTLNIKDLSQATHIFVAHFEDFKTLSSQASTTIETSIKQASSAMAAQTAKEFMGLIGETIQTLKSTTQETLYTLNQAKAYTKSTLGLTYGICLVASVIIAFTISYFFPKKEIIPLSKEIIEYSHAGLTLKKVWPKLSQKEKDHFNTLIKEYS